MRAAATVAVLLALAAPAAAEPRNGMFFDLGVGAPGGVTFGLGTSAGRWRALAEVGGAGAAFVAMLSAQAEIERDVHTWNRSALSVGGLASIMGFMAGSDEVATGTYRGIGPVGTWRRAVSRRTEVAVDVGGLLSQCRGDCNPHPFLLVSVTGRLAVHF